MNFNYRKNIRPFLKKPKVQAYTMLILSLLAMSFFGFFAIRPTLKTIVGLQREIKDSQLVNQALEEKIIALSQAKEEYGKIENDLPLLAKALPAEPKFSFFLEDLENLAKETGITLSGVRLETVDLNQEDLQTPTQITSSLSVEGDYFTGKEFLEHLLNDSRIYLVDRFEINSKEGVSLLDLSLRVDGYYLKTAYVQ